MIAGFSSLFCINILILKKKQKGDGIRKGKKNIARDTPILSGLINK
jgi:hypothetical protein